MSSRLCSNYDLHKEIPQGYIPLEIVGTGLCQCDCPNITTTIFLVNDVHTLCVLIIIKTYSQEGIHGFDTFNLLRTCYVLRSN